MTFLTAFSPIFPNRQAPHRPTNNPNASKFAQRAEGADVCPRCEKTVYAAEKCLGAGKVGTVHVLVSWFCKARLTFPPPVTEHVSALSLQSWHKGCFRCGKCGKGLESTTVADRDGEVFCKGLCPTRLKIKLNIMETYVIVN